MLATTPRINGKMFPLIVFVCVLVVASGQSIGGKYFFRTRCRLRPTVTDKKFHYRSRSGERGRKILPGPDGS